ncbi:hypothetical protein LTR94_035079, partial [Friedmanniomyces endolithicus]
LRHDLRPDHRQRPARAGDGHGPGPVGDPERHRTGPQRRRHARRRRSPVEAAFDPARHALPGGQGSPGRARRRGDRPRHRARPSGLAGVPGNRISAQGAGRAGSGAPAGRKGPLRLS